MNPHTPGPWRTLANTYIGQWQVLSDKTRIATISVRNHKLDGSPELTPQFDAEAEANAALIARAPDLLKERDALKADNTKLRAALANTLAYLEADADDDQERKDHDQARAALNSTQPAP